MAKRKPLTIVEAAKRIDPRIPALFNDMIETRVRMAREFCDGLTDLMDRKQLKEATVASKKQMVMVPTFDNVLVRRDEAASKSPGGILMPDTADKEKPKRGVVVSVGPGRWVKEGTFVEPPCKAGDVVFVRHWNGADVMLGNVKHEIFNAAEIIAVETDDQKVIDKAYGRA